MMRLLRAGTAAGAALACLMAIGAAAPAEAQVDAYMTEVQLFATAYCPDGTFDADGRQLMIRDYQALFAAIGSAYGGDGTQTFNLPDLRGKEPIAGMRYCIVYEGLWPTHP